MESTHCFMLLHHMHSELVLVHSPQVDLMAQGVRQGLALWLAEGHQALKQQEKRRGDTHPHPPTNTPGRSHRLPFTGLMQDWAFRLLDADSAR